MLIWDGGFGIQESKRYNCFSCQWNQTYYQDNEVCPVLY